MFSPEQVEVFRFTSCSFDEASGTAIFGYAFDDQIHFTETFVFPVPDQPLDPERRAAVDRALFLLSIAAGISYYKAAVPPVASIESGTITEYEMEFFRTLYFEGLGEFSYINQLSLRDKPEWKYSTCGLATPPSVGLPRRSLVAVGGGKDSCVSIEALRAGDEPMLLASINQPKAIMQCIKAAHLPSVHAQRTLSSTLFDLNQDGAYNGHVPITAVVSLALSVTALLVGADAVVMSNERSASSGNLEWDGREVNHQYSKSFAAEQALADLLHRSVAADLDYFSLLRPLSELDIARRFAREDRYDKVFTSCNRAFRIDKERRYDHWCCDCDKCRFVFLALAPHLTPKRLKKIFGKDLLEDTTQIPGFEALCGWQADKPFECVGEIEESIAAMVLLGQNPDWSDHAVVRHFVRDVIPMMTLPADLLDKPFVASTEHRLSNRYLQLLGLVHATH